MTGLLSVIEARSDYQDILEWFEENKMANLGLAFSHARTIMGGHPMPKLLFDLRDRGILDRPRDIAMATHVAWTSYSHVWRSKPASEWLDMFRRGGYAVDGVAAERPNHSIKLYRGSGSGRKLNPSWSSNVNTARDYVDAGKQVGIDRSVWVTEAPPQSLLAHISPAIQDEYIVDTEGLKIELFE